MTDPDDHWNDAMDNDWDNDWEYPEDNENLMYYVSDNSNDEDEDDDTFHV